MKLTTKFVIYRGFVFTAFFGGLPLLIAGLAGYSLSEYTSSFLFWLGMIGAALMGLSGPLSLPLQRMEEQYLLMKGEEQTSARK